MLKNLFRPKWQHENPAIRKEAIAKLASSDLPVLEQIALGDKDHNLRQLAISKIDNLDALLRISNQSGIPNDQEFALKCWVSVLAGGEQLSPLAAEQFILDCQDEKLLAGIIAYTDNNSLRELALGGIKHEEQLLALMNSTKNGRVWQIIVEKLHSEDALKKAATIVNGRDKKSQQTIKNKLETIKAYQQAQRHNEEQADYLAGKLQHLLQSESNPLFEGILITANQQWLELCNHIPAEKNSLIKSLVAQCEERLANDKKRKTDIAMEEKQHAIDRAAHHQLLSQFNELTNSLLNNEKSIENISNEKAGILQQWHELKLPALEKEQQLFNKQLAALNNSIEAFELYKHHNLENILAAKNLPAMDFATSRKAADHLQKVIGLLEKSHITGNTDFITRVKMQLSSVIDQQKSLSHQAKTLHKDIQQGLDEAENLVDKKDLKNAQKVFTRVRKALAQLPEQESRTYSSSTQRIFQSIKTLEDWKDYVGDEKRAELIARMKNLIGDNGDLPAKAELIKHLQQDWKNLGHCHDQALWEQFKALADEAYQPCQHYFDEQKKIRQFNAEQRTIICEQLENFLQAQEWNTADWKALDKLHKAVHDEWKKYTPVAREDHQRLHDRFFTSANQLKDKINSERKNNHAKLASIILQAKQLLESTDIQHAIDEYAKLQQQWKSVGITFNKEQHEQWLAFKKAGDALYEKRQNLRHEADHERLNNLARANTLCNDISRLAELDMDELANSRPAFEALKADFKALGSLPKDQFNPCMQAFNKACDAYEKKINNIGKHEWLKQLGVLESLSDTLLDIDLQGEKADIDSLAKSLPEKWRKQLTGRFSSPIGDNPLAHAKTLCIETELLANIDTPNEDAALKMQWQMANLAKNFGQLQSQSTSDKIENLYLRWYSQKCWNREEYKLMEKRFLKAAKIALEN